jgi:hypothetical protein
MESHQLLFGVTAVNLMLAASTWTGTGLAGGHAHPKVLRAESIELVDQRGQARLQLHLGSDGSGNLRIRDGRGRVRIKLGTTADGSTGLVLMDQSIEPTLWLETDRSGTSITLVTGEKRRVVAP